jgi:hypothetical protein
VEVSNVCYEPKQNITCFTSKFIALFSFSFSFSTTLSHNLSQTSKFNLFQHSLLISYGESYQTSPSSFPSFPISSPSQLQKISPFHSLQPTYIFLCTSPSFPLSIQCFLSFLHSHSSSSLTT